MKSLNALNPTECSESVLKFPQGQEWDRWTSKDFQVLKVRLTLLALLKKYISNPIARRLFVIILCCRTLRRMIMSKVFKNPSGKCQQGSPLSTHLRIVEQLKQSWAVKFVRISMIL